MPSRDATEPPAGGAPTPHLSTPWVALALGLVATTLPIFSGYLVAFILLCWLLAAGPWRPGRGGSPPRGPDALATVAAFDRIVAPVKLGVAIMLATLLVAALAAYVQDAAAPALSKALKPYVHLLLKTGLLFVVIFAGVRAVLADGRAPTRLGGWFALWMSVLLVYCVIQRCTGIDWTRGIGAELGPHRYAYGVYRISGFMGHPLTLGYNLVLVALAAFVFVRGATLRSWPVVLATALGILVLSGSRFPLIAFVAALALGLGPLLWRWRWPLLGAAVLGAGAIWLEGSTVQRVGELFDPSRPVTERFDRVVFWQAHWRVFLEHPWVGTGLWGARDAVNAHYHAMGWTERLYGAHNIVLQVLADGGLLSFAGLLAFFVSLFVAARRASAGSAWHAVTPLAVAVLTTGVMQNTLRDSEFLFALWMLLAFAAADAARRAAPGA